MCQGGRSRPEGSSKLYWKIVINSREELMGRGSSSSNGQISLTAKISFTLTLIEMISVSACPMPGMGRRERISVKKVLKIIHIDFNV